MTIAALTALERAHLVVPSTSVPGVDVVIHGSIDRQRMVVGIARVLSVWPELAARAERGRWVEAQAPETLLHRANSAEDFARFRSKPMDPRVEPPLRIVWWPAGGTHRISVAIHPAAADEQALFHVFVSYLLTLVGEVPLVPKARALDLVSVRSLLTDLRLTEVTRLVAQCVQFARRDAVFHLPCGTGPIATYSRWINSDIIADKANRLGTSPLAVMATVWSRALTEVHPTDPRAVIVEVPISVRNSDPALASALGDLVWPVYVPVDRAAPLRDAARAFAGQLRAQTAARLHYARPLAALGRRRFWRVARRFPALDVPPDFASTRVSWTGHPAPLTERLAEHDLRLVDQQIYTAVPPRMGATLTVVGWPYGTQLLVNYRTDSLNESQVAACVSEAQRHVEAQ